MGKKDSESEKKLKEHIKKSEANKNNSSSGYDKNT